MSDTNTAIIALQMQQQAAGIAVLGEVLGQLVNELKRANDLHTQAIESLQAVMRDGDDWWKEGK